MNPISQMTQQELSNLPRALETKPGMGLKLAPLQAELGLFHSKTLSLTSGNPQDGFEVSRKQ